MSIYSISYSMDERHSSNWIRVLQQQPKETPFDCTKVGQPSAPATLRTLWFRNPAWSSLNQQWFAHGNTLNSKMFDFDDFHMAFSRCNILWGYACMLLNSQLFMWTSSVKERKQNIETSSASDLVRSHISPNTNQEKIGNKERMQQICFMLSIKHVPITYMHHLPQMIQFTESHLCTIIPKVKRHSLCINWSSDCTDMRC
jgi:hypothetical protein